MNRVRELFKNKFVWVTLAVIWGFAEATAFFVIPDLLFTAAVIIFGLHFAVRLAGVGALAAGFGGALLYFLGTTDPGSAREFLLSVPLVGEDLLYRVQNEITAGWIGSVFFGALSGVPYKIYAVEAGIAGLSIPAFLVVSVLARFARFALVIGLFSFSLFLLERFKLGTWGFWLWGISWVSVYGIYIFLRL